MSGLKASMISISEEFLGKVALEYIDLKAEAILLNICCLNKTNTLDGKIISTVSTFVSVVKFNILYGPWRWTAFAQELALMFIPEMVLRVSSKEKVPAFINGKLLFNIGIFLLFEHTQHRLHSRQEN